MITESAHFQVVSINSFDISFFLGYLGTCRLLRSVCGRPWERLHFSGLGITFAKPFRRQIRWDSTFFTSFTKHHNYRTRRWVYKGRLISKGIFRLVPTWKNMCEFTTYPQLFTFFLKVEDSYFAHFGRLDEIWNILVMD